LLFIPCSRIFLMIELDGSEAGGQLVRTAAALSAITGKAFKISNIRGARPEPGLKAQHLEGLNALKEICSAEVSGLELGSRELVFIPKKFEPRDLEVKISTAGSIGLVLQALLIAATKFENPIKVKFSGGGTWGKWAPPVLYLEKVFCQLVGSQMETKISCEGFYPKGGANAEFILPPVQKKEIEILEHGKLEKLEIFSVSSTHLQKAKVAERQAEAAKRFLSEKLSAPISVNVNYSSSESLGSGILVAGKCENSFLGADSIGEIKVSAEEVGKRVVKDFLNEFANGAVDRHAADMLMPYMALVCTTEAENRLKCGKIQTSEITQHILTSVELIEKFLPVKFSIDREKKIISVSSINKA